MCFILEVLLINLTALSFDAPVVKNLNPFSGMKAAVTRRDKEGHSIEPGRPAAFPYGRIQPADLFQNYPLSCIAESKVFR